MHGLFKGISSLELKEKVDKALQESMEVIFCFGKKESIGLVKGSKLA